MKKIILLSYIILISLGLSAQVFNKDKGNGSSDGEIRTLMGNSSQAKGGYGSFGAAYTMIDGKDAVTVSGRGALILGHSVAIGFAGTGFMNAMTPDIVPNRYVNLNGGYGGLLIEPIVLAKSPVHLSFPIIAGAGGIAYTSSFQRANSWEYYDTYVEDTQTYLIAEPGAEVELNVLKFFRMAFGLSYRFTTDIEWNYTGPDVLEGWSAGMTFKFGKF